MADRVHAAVWVPNLFLRVPVDTALRAAGAVPTGVRDLAGAAEPRFRLAVIDLDACPDAEAAVRTLVGLGKTVLATGPHVQGPLLAACRAAGAVVLPRSAFLARLPELLEEILPRLAQEAR